tara:strand:+ start:4064 stop:4216 length:153 start_codon:yes stop_codon:yes gene_type:complete
MASTRRKPAQKKNTRSDMRRAMKHRLAVSYVKGQRAGGKRAVKARMGDDD